VFNQAEVDDLIIHFRQELDEVERAIVALERMNGTQRAAAARVMKRPIASDYASLRRAGKGWMRHRLHGG
jgi:hypothetical protein